MSKYSRLRIGIAGITMLFLIYNTKVAVAGVYDGILLALRSVIPSLFPFIFLSHILNNALLGQNIPLIRPVCRLCGIPRGCEGLFLIGLIGGYPVGAQNIYSAYKAGIIDRNTAHRLLGFCNNAGPAFLFGMVGPLFQNPVIPWMLWLLHIGSAVFVGAVLPGKTDISSNSQPVSTVTVTAALTHSVRSIGLICGWVILFRMILTVFISCFPAALPGAWQVLLGGILELSNGCCALSEIASEGTQFVLAAFFLAWGGCCVAMQTRSAVKELGTGMYFPGKVLQALVSVLIAIIIQALLFTTENQAKLPQSCYWWLSILTILVTVILRRKKNSSIPAEIGV